VDRPGPDVRWCPACRYVRGVGVSPFIKRKPELNVPVIKVAYAIDQGIYATILNIYLEAEDPNGDMAKIATTVDQVACGHHLTDFIMLKPESRKHFTGYIQWDTWSSHAASMPDGNYVAVKVNDQDKNPLTFNDF
jgi:hypothetical protein